MTEADVKAHQAKHGRKRPLVVVASPGERIRNTLTAAAARAVACDVDAQVLAGLRPDSKIERRFAQQLAERGIPAYVRDYFFIEGRDFELDFAWPALKFAVSIEGQAHRVKARFLADTEKHALGLIAGWKILRVAGKDVRDGRAIEWTWTLLREMKGVR